MEYEELFLESAQNSGPLQHDFDETTRCEILDLYNGNITPDEFMNITRLNRIESKEVMTYIYQSYSSSKL